MAKYLKYKETHPVDDDTLGDGYKIRVLCDTSTGIEYFKDKELVESEKILVKEVPEFRGGGDPGYLSLMSSPLFLALSFFIVLATRGFFEELGRQLVFKLFNKLKSQKRPSEIFILGEGFQLNIIIPVNVSEDDCKKLADLINELIPILKENARLEVLYDKKSKKIVTISE